jgi:hypothetical protein
LTEHLCGAALAFFAFAVSLVIGLYVGNTFVTVVLRSLVVLFVAYIVGAILASLGQRAVLENVEAETPDVNATAEVVEPGAPEATQVAPEPVSQDIAAQPPPEPAMAGAT